MILARLTWKQVRALSREVVVVVPTGSLEQHGPHLPLFTDSLLVTAAAKAIERNVPEKILLTPTHWLGCSGHHLAFNGSLSNSFGAYTDGLEQTAECLIAHGFFKFFFLNGHGGNSAPNNLVCRNLKAKHKNIVVGTAGYFDYIPVQILESTMEGKSKKIQHACEAEASLMMHLHPELVHQSELRDDGLATEPTIQGLTLHFDELTEEGSLGYATLATAPKGKILFEAAVEGATAQLSALADGFALVEI